MNIPKQCIIWGGGESIKVGLSLNLTEKILDNFVIGCNFSFHHYKPTFTAFIDSSFYRGKLKKYALPDENHIQSLKKQSLLVGYKSDLKSKELYNNTIILKGTPNYSPNIEKNGLYAKLTGIFATSLASYLMDYSGIIFLLGMDWTLKGNTHYYPKNEIDHSGQGYVNWYKTHSSENSWSPFLNYKDIKIYNVSLSSNITCFEKISYRNMFKLLDYNTYNQTILRETIKSKLVALA